MLKIYTFLAIYFLPFHVISQILPVEGSSLNFRVVGFSFHRSSGTGSYRVEIAKGNYHNSDSFRRNIIISFATDTNKAIIELPEFGKEYTWHVIPSDRKLTIAKDILRHFRTLTSSRTDTSTRRLRVLQAAALQCKENYVCTDAGTVFYDMGGSPVGYIRDSDAVHGDVQDVKFTQDSTITFISGVPVEMSLNGSILWKAPRKRLDNKDSVFVRYHHELTKLSNGHYLTLAMQSLMCKQVRTKDSSYIIVSEDKVASPGYKRAPFGMLIEYDKSNHVVWSWKSSEYLLGSDFDYFNPIDTAQRFDPHANAFYFDEVRHAIFVSFRNLNRIMKIDYPSGKVLAVYGEVFKPGSLENGKSLFCNQHSIRVSQEGYLYYFNNNTCHNTDALPTIVMLKEPASGKGSLEKIWEYTCTVEEGYQKRFLSAGNVIELADRSMFVCMGSEYSKLFIVNKEKEVLWSALPEIYSLQESKWVVNRQDRCNIISRRQLEELIWKAESM